MQLAGLDKLLWIFLRLLNYNAAFKNIQQLQDYTGWQNAGLVGVSKKLNIKTKWTKGTKLSLLYDMLYREHRRRNVR